MSIPHTSAPHFFTSYNQLFYGLNNGASTSSAHGSSTSVAYGVFDHDIGSYVNCV